MRKKLIFAVCVLFVGLVGGVDYLTGFEVALGPFYLLPVIVAAMFVGPLAGIGMAILGVATWCLMDRLGGHHYSHWWIFHWNAGMRLLTFLIVAALSSLLGRVLGLDSMGGDEQR